MCQDRLVGLATLSIEHELADKLDLKDLVINFAQKKARKVQFGYLKNKNTDMHNYLVFLLYFTFYYYFFT